MHYIITIAKVKSHKLLGIRTKLHVSGDLGGNITEFGVADESPEPAKQRSSTGTPK